MPTQKEDSPASKKGVQYKRSENFQKFYANNAYLLSSAWDLRIVFGQLDETGGPNHVLQDHSVTLPWPQAKVLMFYLQMHVLGREAEVGHIDVPPGIIGEIPKQPPSDTHLEAWKAVRKLYEEFVAANPEMVSPPK